MIDTVYKRKDSSCVIANEFENEKIINQFVGII